MKEELQRSDKNPRMFQNIKYSEPTQFYSPQSTYTHKRGKELLKVTNNKTNIPIILKAFKTINIQNSNLYLGIDILPNRPIDLSNQPGRTE